MAKSKPNHNKHWDVYAVLHREKVLLEKYYTGFRYFLSRAKLRCLFSIPSPTSDIKYKIEVEYAPPHAPKVRVVDPPLELNQKTHAYSDESLCLFYPGDLNWSYGSHHLYDKIIPWTAEWIVFYELYQITGHWEGPEAPHRIV